MINRELIRLKVIQLVYAHFQNRGKSLETAEKELAFSLQKSYELYKFLLNLLVEVRQFAERKADSLSARAARMGNEIDKTLGELRIAQNKLLLKLEENNALRDFREHRQQWEEEPTFVKKLYTTFTDSDIYGLYIAKEDYCFAADREVIRKPYKTHVCENEDFEPLLEEHSLYWNDDKDVIDTFVLKTIRRFNGESGPDQELLPAFASDEDEEFAGTLFRETLLRSNEMQELMRDNVKNWSYDRLALMDAIIMQTALTEILTFPDIPLNVSINEYLDIAKVYSTPRSTGYINGFLDAVVKKLHRENKLLKTTNK